MILSLLRLSLRSQLRLRFVKTSRPKKISRRGVEEFAAIEQEYKATLDASIREAVQAEQLPPGVVGLIPDGNRKVEWRWKGPVFEDGTEDILNSSIVVRNLQELGVNSIEALRYLFPDKTDEERSAMLSGYPFRMAQATQQSIGSFLSLIENMRQVPHPQAPDLPLLADPKLDLTPYVYRALDFLKRELTYAGQYSDATGAVTPQPSIPSSAPAPTQAYQSAPAQTAQVSSPTPSVQQPVDQAPQAYQPQAEPQINPWQEAFNRLSASLSSQQSSQAQAPSYGTTQQAPSRGLSAGAQLPVTGELQQRAFDFGDADLSAPTNAGLFPGDSGTDAELQQRRESTKQSRERRVSRKRQRRKS